MIPDNVVQKLLQLFQRRSLEDFGEASWRKPEMLEAFHDSCGTSDDQNANKNAGSKDCGNEVSYRNRTLIEDST
jgi:hypothetical protein